MTDIPTCEFRDPIKSIRIPDLSDQQRFVLRYVFPNFMPEDVMPSAQIGLDLDMHEAVVSSHARVAHLRATTDDARSAREILRQIARRFAGDYTLPRERYFTVAQDDDGHDDGTLLNELLAYTSPDYSGPIVLGEFLADEQIHALGLDSSTRGIGVTMLEPRSWMEPRSGGRSLWLPVRVQRERISRCVDLRTPEAQTWFAQTFSRLEALVEPEYLEEARQRAAEGGWRPPSRFTEFLPLLMDAQQGGSDTTSRIGLWLRRHRVEGFVFPSARSIVDIRLSAGNRVGSQGWLFVDYSGSSTPNVKFRSLETNPWDASTPVTVEGHPQMDPVVSWCAAGALTRSMARAVVLGPAETLFEARRGARPRRWKVIGDREAMDGLRVVEDGHGVELAEALGRLRSFVEAKASPVDYRTVAVDLSKTAAQARRHAEIVALTDYLRAQPDYLARVDHLFGAASESGALRDSVLAVFLEKRIRDAIGELDSAPYTWSEMRESLGRAILRSYDDQIEVSLSATPRRSGFERCLRNEFGTSFEAFVLLARRLGIFAETDGTLEFANRVIRDHVAFEHALRVLNQRESERRCQAALLLGDVADLRAARPLADAVADRREGPRLRACAAMALAALRDECSVVPLVLALDEDAEVGRRGERLGHFARAGLKQLGGLAVHALCSLLDSPHAIVRAKAMDALMLVPDKSAISALERLTDDSSLLPPNLEGLQGDTVGERARFAIEFIKSMAAPATE